MELQAVKEFALPQNRALPLSLFPNRASPLNPLSFSPSLSLSLSPLSPSLSLSRHHGLTEYHCSFRKKEMKVSNPPNPFETLQTKMTIAPCLSKIINTRYEDQRLRDSVVAS